MSTAKRGLGRGLGALIGTAPTPASTQSASNSTQQTKLENTDAAVSRETNHIGSELGTELPAIAGLTLVAVSPDQVSPNPRQPRTEFDPADLAELRHSIQEIGLLQPIVVRPSGSGYELIAGERRLRAAKELGLEQLPALIRETDDAALLRDALLENLHRSQLNPIEEAAAYQQLLEDFDCTHEELAERIGRSRPQITNMLRLLRLPPQVQQLLMTGSLSNGHARALLGLSSAIEMETLATRVVTEGLSVRKTEELVAVSRQPSEAVPQAPASKEQSKKPSGQGSQGEAERSRDTSETHPDVAALGEPLADYLDTRVEITQRTNGRGSINIEFADTADLRRILRQIEDKTPK